MTDDRKESRPAYASDLWEMYDRLNSFSIALGQLQSVVIDMNARLFELSSTVDAVISARQWGEK